MKVILRTRIEALGRPGDVVDVAVGYARNYLLPQQKAYAVNADNLSKIEAERDRFEEEEKQRIAGLRAFAEEIRGKSCTIEAKAGEDGHLYGSVTAPMIAEALGAEGIEVEPKQVLLEKPIKETGVVTVGIHLHGDIESEVKVWVMDSTAEESSDDEAEGSGGEGAEPAAAEGEAKPEAEATAD